MRNVLAHEVNEIDFKAKHIIDQLSFDCIMQYPLECLEGLDINKMDNISINLYSNIIYMHKIIDQLHKM